MNVTALFVLAVAGGYTFATILNASRFNSVRESGHRTYFRAVFYAFVLYVISAGIYVFLASNAYFPFDDVALPLDYKLLFVHVTSSDGALPILLLGSFVVAVPLALLINIPFHLSETLELKLIRSATRNSDFETLLLDALLSNTPLLVTLTNGKVYVGWVLQGPDPGVERRYMRLLPILSGYRTEVEHRLRFTTNYVPVLQKAEQGQLNSIRPEDLDAVIPVDGIAYAHLFDEDVYQAFPATVGAEVESQNDRQQEMSF